MIKVIISSLKHKIWYRRGEILSHRFWIKRRAKEVKKILKLNKKTITQVEALRLIDEKMNKEYVDFVSSNKSLLKIVHFDICLAIQEGSVMGNVFFEETVRLKKT